MFLPFSLSFFFSSEESISFAACVSSSYSYCVPMWKPLLPLPLLLRLLLFLSFQQCCYLASTSGPPHDDPLVVRFFHRYSVVGRELLHRMRVSSQGDAADTHPARRTPQFYKLLEMHDRRRLGATPNVTLAFSSGNETINYGEALGWLHYAVIDIGTPNTSFLVALDTGSDQLWVPCQCKQCASISTTSELINFPLQVYEPSVSNTSKQITCDSNLCYTSSQCKDASYKCEYTIRYLSDETTSSGILVEDVIHLKSAMDDHGGSIEFPFVFGCAQVQSGSFLTGGAPDGLLGLGFRDISLPSSLAKAGLIKNSFSMCFQDDGSGRIFLGDRGSPSQETTPLLSSSGKHVTYVVEFTKISVGSKTFDLAGVPVIIDTGTSFTYLPLSVYSIITTEFDEQVQHERTNFKDIPWEFCYKVSSDNDVLVPNISFVFQGGGNFSVLAPLLGIVNNSDTVYGFCLAIFESNITILGQNFMIGYDLVFDREDMKLGWSPSDCSNLERSLDAGLPPVPAPAYPARENASAPAMPHYQPPVVGCSSIHRHLLYNTLIVFILHQVVALNVFT